MYYNKLFLRILIVVSIVSLGGGAYTFGQEQIDQRSQVTIERKDKTIRVIQNGTRAEGARTILLNPKCKEEIRLSTFYAPVPAYVEALVNETRIVSSIAFIEKPDKKNKTTESAVEANVQQDIVTAGLELDSQPLDSQPLDSQPELEPNAPPQPELVSEENSQPESDPESDLGENPQQNLEPEKKAEKETLEMFGGSLEFTRTRCPENTQASTAADVTVEEGRSTITGSKFFYNNATGIGDMAGPINLEREAKGDSPALTGTSDTMEFNVDEDLTILKGNVEVKSDGRVSKADTVEFDEQSSLAILLGNPATSNKDNDVVKGNVITYYLDSNDVVVDKNIQANFELE